MIFFCGFDGNGWMPWIFIQNVGRDRRLLRGFIFTDYTHMGDKAGKQNQTNKVCSSANMKITKFSMASGEIVTPGIPWYSKYIPLPDLITRGQV